MRRRRAARAPALPAGHCYAMAQRSSADGNERSGVTGKSDSVKRPREGHSELPREDDSAKRSREGDSELPCESDSDSELEGDSELPRDSDSESDREASGSSKRHRVDKHSISFDPGWVRRWDWLRPVHGSSPTVMGLLCHLC